MNTESSRSWLLRGIFLAMVLMFGHACHAATSKCGQIIVNERWTPDKSPYTICASGLSVKSGVTLTIESGVVVKFQAGASLVVNGAISAVGSAASRIIFTSIRDDSAGGDTDGDGGANQPTAGDWKYVWIGGVGSSALLRYCEFRYCGTTSSPSAGLVGTVKCAFDVGQCKVVHSLAGGVNADDCVSLSMSDTVTQDCAGVGMIVSSSPAPAISRCTVDGDSGGMRLLSCPSATVSGCTIGSKSGDGLLLQSCSSPTVTSNAIANTGGVKTGNAVLVTGTASGDVTFSGTTPTGYATNGIVFSSCLVSTSSRWRLASDTACVLWDVRVAYGASLSIEPGAVVKFRSGGASLVCNGVLVAGLTGGQRTYFTSIRDDTVGGDTNNDSGATSPSPGDWTHLWAGGAGSELRLANCEVRYGGANASPYGAVACTSSGKLYTNDCVVRHSLSSGVHASYASYVQLSTTTVEGCGSSGIDVRYAPASSVHILSCVARNNAGCGIYLETDPQCRVEGAVISGNTGEGLRMVSCTSPSFTGNSFAGNGGAAAALSGTIIGDIGNASNSASGNLVNGVVVSNSTCGTTRWLSCSMLPYVLSEPLNIASGNSLTLDPGVIIKLQSASRITCAGTLTALGTSGAPINITSIRDDTVGGDTNNDGSLSTPARGDWKHVCINGVGAQGTLRHCVARYGGQDEWPQSVLSIANSGSLVVSDCSVSHSAGPGIHVDGGGAGAVSLTGTDVSACATQGIQIFNCPRPVVENCAVHGNSGIGIRISGCASPRLLGNTISGNSGSAVTVALTNGDLDCSGNNGGGNAVNGIVLLTNSSDFAISTDTVWHANPTLPYAPSNAIVQSAGTTWTLDPGVVIKPPLGAYRILCNGRLVANGTASQPVCITSYRDDAVGGDTDGDMSSSLPVAGNWKHLRISGPAASATLSHCRFTYGGQIYSTQDFPQAAVTCTDGGTMTLFGCLVSRSKSCGVVADGVTGLRIEQTSCDACVMDGVRATNCPELLIDGCSLASGTGDGLVAQNCASPTIRNSTTSGCTNGFLLTDCSSPEVDASTASGNRAWGISVGNSTGVSVTNSTVTANGAGGLTVSSCQSCTLSSNSFTGNIGYAAMLTGSLGDAYCASNSASGNAVNGIVLKQAALGGDSQWHVNTLCPYVITGGLTVSPGATVTLAPGVTVKLVNPGGSIDCHGGMTAQGLAGSRITFTSLSDDSTAGDTNGDLSGSAPVPGDWNHVWINGTGASGTFANCDMRYGGSYTGTGDVPEANLACSDGGSVAVTGCQLSNSLSYGLYVSGQAGLAVSGTTVAECGRYGIQLTQCPQASITGCSLTGNTSIGLNMCACPASDLTDNTFTGNSGGAAAMSDDIGDVDCSGNSASGNGVNGLLLSEAVIDGASRWHLNPDFPYVINGTLSITATGNLTLDPGVIVKLDVGGHRIDCSGTLNATGTAGSTIYFTSINDDAIGGDTNGDMPSSPPASGDWNHILLKGPLAHGTFERCIVRYGGGCRDYADLPQANLACSDQASLVVSRSDITSSSNIGVFADSGTTVLENTIIAHNDSCGVYLTGGTCYLHYCDLWSNPYNFMDSFSEITCVIQGDPRFTDLISGDYRLTAASACIDKGDPAITDADGTRLDIGALPYESDAAWQGIADAKGCLDGTQVGIESVIVTMGTDAFAGVFYVENENRTSGIRVTTNEQLLRGTCVSVIGAMATVNGERQIQSSVIQRLRVAAVPAPVFMANKLMGGGDGRADPSSGTRQVGVSGGSGLNNIGLLVSTYGRVTYLDAQTVLIDDGSHTPVKCVAPPGVLGPGLTFARVTGISSCDLSGGLINRVLLIRGADDLCPM